MDDWRKEDAVVLVPGIAAGTGAAVVWKVKPEYCRCCPSLTLPSCKPSLLSGAVPIQFNGSKGNEPVVGDGNKLGVRRIGESRKPVDMLLKYDDGDAGGKEVGGVMAMEFDCLGPPLQPPAENEELAKANATGPELASAAPELARSRRGRRRRGRRGR